MILVLTKPGTRHLTVIAALLAMIGLFSIDAYLPSFPEIEAEFGISRALLSQSLGVYLMAFAVSTLFWGPLADRYGRRLVMSQVMMLFALALALAPVLGGRLHDHFGWRSIFWLLSVFGSLLVLMGFFISEILNTEHRRSIHPATVMRLYIGALLHKRFPALILCLSLSFGGLFLYIAGAPTVIYHVLGLGSEDFGWLFIPIVTGLILGAAISGRLSHRWPAQKTISVGLLVMMAATALNLASVNLTTASIVAVPLLHANWLNFVLGQLVFLLLAAGLWYHLRKGE